MKWEYDVRCFSAFPAMNMLKAVLNSIGDEGWELVTLDHDTMLGIFKRPKLDIEDAVKRMEIAYQGKPCDNLNSEDVREVIEIDDCCTTIAAGCGCSCTT